MSIFNAFIEGLTVALSSSASPTDRNAKIKIVAAGVCLLIAGVLLAHNFGVITLWGGMPTVPPPTPEEIARMEELKRKQEEAQKKIDAMPVNKRPIPAGAG